MIKKLILIFAVLCGGVFANETASITVKADQRVMLVSIVARLAGWPGGYTDPAGDDPFVQAVDRHFERSKNHPLIEYARSFRADQYIGYDAIPQLAIMLDDPGPDMKAHRCPVYNNKWTGEMLRKYIPLLGQFYVDADCAAFFDSQAALLEEDAEELRGLLKDFDPQWLRDFFGYEGEQTFTIVPTRLNSSMEFGAFTMTPDGMKDFLEVMPFRKGKSHNSYQELVAVMFNLYYIHTIMSEQVDDFREAGKRLLPLANKAAGQELNENWHSLLAKNLSSAISVRYMMAHGASEEHCNKVMQLGLRSGYVLVPRLVGLLDTYETQRETYPNFGEFAPEILRFLQQYGDGNNTDIQAQAPRVVKIDEFHNGSQDVDPGLTQITIRFDQPMMQDRYSIYTTPKGDKDRLPMKSGHFVDSKTFILELDALEPGHDYKFILKGKDAKFRSTAGISLEDCQVNFTTRS